MRNDLDARRVPLCLALPAMYTHRAQADGRDRPVAIAKLDAGAHLGNRALDAHVVVDPVRTG